MKLLDWTEVHLVVKTMIENKVDLSGLDEKEHYLIEKLVNDVIFPKVRAKQLENKKEN